MTAPIFPLASIIRRMQLLRSAALRRAARVLPAVGLSVLVSCAPAETVDVLTVYSPHGPDLLEGFEKLFEEQNPGVDVQWMDLGSQEVLDRIRSERANPQADVWFGAPSQLFADAAADGLLEPFAPTWAATVGENRDPQSLYHGVYLTPEIIAFNSAVVDSASAPTDWDQVLEPQWKGKVIIRDPIASGTMRTIFGMIIQRSIRETGSPEGGFQWLARLHGQTKEYVLNPTLLYQKLARQEGVVTLWDMPDILELRARTEYPIDYRFPTSGTPVVVDAIAVVKGSPNPELAKRFVEYIGSEAGVMVAARDFFRLPARSDIPADSLPAVLRRARDEIKTEPMDWKLLQESGSDWMRRWDETIPERQLMLRLEALGKRFGDTTAVSDLSLEVAEGEFLSLLGPSGCGKTTTLRMIAGFETPTSGRIFMRGRDVTRLRPQDRGAGMVFQNYALFPHLDVFENVAFGLKAQGFARGEIAGRVDRALELVDLTGYDKRRVQALSGGQQQRVALARAIAPEPPILLLDEPLSNLDAALRERTRTELRDLLKRLGMTAVFVTHDQAEAFDLSDRIAIMNRGRLQQLGAPEELYLSPTNEFVAAFVGKANFFPARVVSAQAGTAVCEIGPGARWTARAADAGEGKSLRVMVRPESLRLEPASTQAAQSLQGKILERRFAGAVTNYRVLLADGREVLVSEPGAPRDLSTEVTVSLVNGLVPPAFSEGASPE